MSVTVPIELSQEIDVRTSADQVFEVLADVPTSASHFPDVERLVDLGGNRFRWELRKVGTAQVHIQTVYAAEYHADRRKLRIGWTPVEGIGNASIGGSWTITERKGSTRVRLQVHGEIRVPLPALMKLLVVPVVTGEHERLVRQYLRNLVAHFGAAH